MLLNIMKNRSGKIVKLLSQDGVLKFGEFVLRSGEKSDYYCDIKQALGNPKILKIFVSGMVKLVPKKATCICGSGYGGITLASLVA